jgi:hypothetical protein
VQAVLGTATERALFARASAVLWVLGGVHDFLRPGAAVVTRRTVVAKGNAVGTDGSGGKSGAEIARAALLHSLGAVDGWSRHVRELRRCGVEDELGLRVCMGRGCEGCVLQS